MIGDKSRVPVADLPFVDDVKELPVDERRRLGLYLPSGHLNDYRVAYMKGQAGFRTEETFDRSVGKRGGHTCCGSLVVWRHKVACPRLRFDDESEAAS